MRSVNKVILIGNLTRDPEMRQTPNGQQVCTFGIATNRQWMAKDGGKHSSAEFHELVAWARLAEICGSYLKKGKLIYIEGYLKTRTWDTPEGIRRHKTEVIVQDMIMLDKRSDNEGEADYSNAPAPDKEAEAASDLSSDLSSDASSETSVKEEASAKEEETPAPKSEEPVPEPEGADDKIEF